MRITHWETRYYQELLLKVEHKGRKLRVVLKGYRLSDHFALEDNRIVRVRSNAAVVALVWNFLKVQLPEELSQSLVGKTPEDIFTLVELMK